MATPFFYRTVGGCLLLAGSVLLNSCRAVCDDNLPQYNLSAGQQAWTAPFALNAVWRFRNPAGYERTYRVTSSQTDMEGGGGKSSVCPSYYREYVAADLERTDSTFTGSAKKTYHLLVSATLPGTQQEYLNWQSFSFGLPLEAAEAGQYILPTAVFGGRTYSNVLEVANYQLTPRVLNIYMTKADGVVAFDDPYGIRWARQ